MLPNDNNEIFENDQNKTNEEVLSSDNPYAPNNIKNPYIYTLLKRIISSNHKDTIMSLISLETGIREEKELELLYSSYMENDEFQLLNDSFYV